MVRSYLEEAFPKLKNNKYKIASPATTDYNCIAWAVCNSNRWWWPDPLNIYYWPESAPREYSLEAFIQLFRTFRYEICSSSELERGFEKVAIYADRDGRLTHAARQLSSWLWTSKLGRSVDIEHELDTLTNGTYGTVAKVLKRPIKARKQKTIS